MENPYLQIVPAPPNGSGRRPLDGLCETLYWCGKRVEVATRKAQLYADNLWNHLRISPSFTDAAMARIAQGTKVLAEGGHDELFHQMFEKLPGEKLLKAYVCYLSTSSGPIIGTLYLSAKRVAFCSDYPFSYYSATGQQQWMYYKVVLPLDQIRAVNPSSNRMNPSEKHIQIVTRDDHEFWYMGFLSYDKALKHLSETLQRSRNSVVEIVAS